MPAIPTVPGGAISDPGRPRVQLASVHLLEMSPRFSHNRFPTANNRSTSASRERGRSLAPGCVRRPVANGSISNRARPPNLPPTASTQKPVPSRGWPPDRNQAPQIQFATDWISSAGSAQTATFVQLNAAHNLFAITNLSNAQVGDRGKLFFHLEWNFPGRNFSVEKISPPPLSHFQNQPSTRSGLSAWA